MFGLSFEGRWNATDIFELMVARCGIDPDPRHIDGPDTIDPDLTIDALERFADRSRWPPNAVSASSSPPAPGRRARHPRRSSARTGAAGCTLLTPAAGATVEEWRSWGPRCRTCAMSTGSPCSIRAPSYGTPTSPVPMQMILAALAGGRAAAARPGGRRPRLGRRCRRGRNRRDRVRRLQRSGAVRGRGGRQGAGERAAGRQRRATSMRRSRPVLHRARLSR